MMNYNEPELPDLIDYSKDKWEIRIDYDTFGDSPRAFDNLGTICVPNNCKYCESEYEDTESLSWYNEDDDFKTLERRGFIALPLSCYVHTGVTIYVGDKCDDWDSGRIGWYIVSKQKVKKEYRVKRISPKLLEKVKDVLINEVRMFNQHKNGDVYEYSLLHNGEEVDYCCGFYGTDDGCNGLVEDMYKHFPKDFTDVFTVEQAKEMVTTPWSKGGHCE